MAWEERLPPEISGVEHTPEGFRGAVNLHVDDEGYFGRECPSCDRFFKMDATEYEALPEELQLTCPYSGHREEHSEFMTADQREVAEAAMHALAEQYIHDAVNDMFGSTFGRSSPRSGHGSGVTVAWRPGQPPPIRQLPSYVEQGTRRVIECESCHNHYAIYGASGFCPVCGPRPEIENVVAAIERARMTLALEDQLDSEQAENLRAAGVFDGFAAEVVKQAVTLFEVFAAEQFRERASAPDQVLKGKGNIFQRLDDADRLFQEHVGIDLQQLVGEATWKRLKQTFEQRHVLTHRNGRVDQRYLDNVLNTRLSIGQRLVISRDEADQALTDLEQLVDAIATEPS
jgi:hypothetical protein